MLYVQKNVSLHINYVRKNVDNGHFYVQKNVDSTMERLGLYVSLPNANMCSFVCYIKTVNAET